MPGGRMIKVWVRADLERILGQPEELFIHALSPEVGVPDSGRNNDCDQDGGSDCDPRLPPLCRYLAIGWQWRNFGQYRQRAGIDQVGFAADAIIHEFHADAE